MNETTVEAINAIVRPLVTVIFAAAIVWGFVVAKIVSVDAFMGIAGIAIGFWFNRREDDKTARATAKAVKAATKTAQGEKSK